MELRKMNLRDAEAQWRYTTATPRDENGFTNPYSGISYEEYVRAALPKLMSYEHPTDMPDWFVPESYYYLWDGGRIVGEFRIRHRLTEALKNGAGHIGYSILRDERGKGYGTKGLELTLRIARQIVPEDEIYLRVQKQNIASQKVMLRCGARRAGEDEDHYFMRIPKTRERNAMGNKLFGGIIPALVTPFNEDGTLREDQARKMIEYQIREGVQGFYICGSTGEGPALCEETRMRMAEVTVDQAAGRAKVIAHVGAPDALSAIRLAKHAEKTGCDGISSVPPTFYYGYGEDEIYAYYRALSDACALPLLVYATDMFKQPDITPFIDRLMGLEHVIGLKFTRTNYYEMRRIIELRDGDINVINGPDEMLICGLAMGADGGIGSTYNLMPALYLKEYRLFAQGDLKGACEIQYKINRCVAVLLKYGVIPSIKHVLTVQGFDAGSAAFPGKRFTPAEEEALMRDLDGIRFFEEYWHCAV